MIDNPLMHIEVYDMLVFEDEDGNIYQDGVCTIGNYSNSCKYIDCSNNFTIYLDENNEIKYITSYYEPSDCKLKEIWSRVDEDTYKRVWRDK